MLCSAIFLVAIAARGVSTAAQTPTPRYCQLPDAAGEFETATGAEVSLNQTIVDAAIDSAAEHGAVSIKVFRHNCLVGSSPLSNPVDTLRRNIFSATKGVVSILTGIALDQGKLQLDDPIGLYLPAESGWGDDAARNITIRQLLHETAGMEKGVVAEGITVLIDQSLPQEALAQNLIHEPGTVFAYSQRVPDLVAYVVSCAVGQELQEFAQTYLFDPVGIPADSYVWLRDRSGNTYGYAYLYLSSKSFARLGLMMQNGGTWNSRRVLSSAYVSAVAEPSPHNPCYGLLFWTNAAAPCLSPTGFNFNRTWLPSSPPDLFAMSGSPQQKNFMIPSLNITVSWAGVLTRSAPSADVWYKFFLALMPGVTDIEPFVPGPYSLESASLETALEALEPDVLWNDLVSSSDCNVLVCNGEIPVEGLVENVASIAKFLGYSINAIFGGKK